MQFKNYTMIFLFLVCISAQAQKSKNVKYTFHTTDLANFIKIFRTVDSANRIQVFQTEYLDKGTAGLQNYAALRFEKAAGLVERIYNSQKFYTKFCETIEKTDFAAIEKSAKQAIDKFLKLYPNAVVPDIYFLVGGLGNGSTLGEKGLLIGLDSYLLCFEDKTKIVDIEAVIAHELIHFNQSFLKDASLIEGNLLAQIIKEGNADFIGELISGKVAYCILEAYQYGEKNLKALWADLQKDMEQKAATDKWLYNEQPDRPASLGYFMGYKITKAYYDKAKNKKKAIHTILNLKADEFDKFLEDSGFRVE